MESSEHRIRVPRTGRYRVVGDPGVAEEVWFVLHGYRQLAERFIRRFDALPGLGTTRAVVAPEALSRFYVEREVGPHGPDSRVGASWMTRADREHEIRDYVEYLDRVAAEVLPWRGAAPEVDERAGSLGSAAAPTGPLDAGDRRLVVLGFSQGCETASRWVAYGRVRPDALVLWGGALATDLTDTAIADRLETLPLSLVVGEDDPWAKKRAAQTVRRLQAEGIEPERIDYAGGHRVEEAVLRRHWPL